jgi:hypothetical protein
MLCFGTIVEASMHRNRAIVLLAAVLALSGCASVKSHWPFGRGKAAAPEPVRELVVKVRDDQMPIVLQFWERNTLVLDLQGVPSAGSVMLSRQDGHRWPARLALRMPAARFEALEVRGAQRVVLPVSAGAGVVTAELPPGVYTEGTASLMVSWGAQSAF